MLLHWLVFFVEDIENRIMRLRWETNLRNTVSLKRNLYSAGTRGIHPRVSSHKRSITHNVSFSSRYNYERLFISCTLISAERALSLLLFLSLSLPKYTINDWSMASSLLFRFKRSLPTTPRLSRIYTVRSWWAFRINHPTWMHLGECVFLLKRSTARKKIIRNQKLFQSV